MHRLMPRPLHRWPLLLVLVLTVPAAPADTKSDTIDLARFDRQIKPSDRRHWAYQPVKPQPVPAVKDTAWVRNPIDAFVLAKLEAKGWKPAPVVEPRALLRRIHLDLIGLPPTPQEQEALLNDRSPDALARVVDRLLANPHYGERWGRHWLDLARYAETNGYERDATRPHVWRYRDYVIRAFNQDKPFDRFILEQLAGDELPDSNAETLIATGFHRLGPWDDEPADPQEDRFDQLDDMVNTTSLTFLGLTLSCARCHDHKFEALTMHDYYRLVAVFNPLRRPTLGRFDIDLPAGTRPELDLLARHDRAITTLKHVAPAHPALAALALPAAAALRQHAPNLPRGYFLHEPSPRSPDTHLLIRGKAARPGPKVEPGLPAVLVRAQPEFPPPGERTSLRRLTLARWIASPENPLTARVIVNRVWQWHFGEGLVRTPSDFGTMGDAPSHPELLDWLAGWFVREGWSLKKLHRLILASNTYRMSKRQNAEYAKTDPDNRLLWRFPYRRLEVEAIRDSMLAASGKLNRQMYGPSMYPFVPKAALASHSDPDKIWPQFNERDASRRTVYAFIKRSMVVPLLEVLDLCDTARPADRRLVTTVAPQALTLFNGDFVNRQARHLAERLRSEAGEDPGRQIGRAFVLALCRPPSASERAALLGFLEREATNLTREAVAPAEARRRALEQACRVILNLNEFVYPD
ncbi:MAG: DUF1549 and DUF1553 domain-containing protein [Gemmataceae bacterium]|nr:DUF1549 and DUF1553 domain-containing protein [Gemmataceae bacterium]